MDIVMTYIGIGFIAGMVLVLFCFWAYRIYKWILEVNDLRDRYEFHVGYNKESFRDISKEIIKLKEIVDELAESHADGSGSTCK